MEIQIIPHPYTYMPAKAVKDNDGVLKWYDLETGEELPPYYGYGTDAQQKVNQWYENRKGE